MATRVANVESIACYFESLSDPRHTRNRKHRLIDIVVIAVCGLVCGSDGPTAIHRWATNRRDWLEGFLALPNGIPSRDCIRRVLIALQPEAFPRCFRDWIADVLESDEVGPSRLVAIDGKTCRRTSLTGAKLCSGRGAEKVGVKGGFTPSRSRPREPIAVPVGRVPGPSGRLARGR